MFQHSCIALIALTLLASCGRDPGPGPEIHDTKYVAVGADGDPLAQRPPVWPCVLDQFTGLMWEVKSDRPGLHDWRNTYTWWDPDEDHDGELDYRGTPDGGRCGGSACDTLSYAAAVNQAGLCGHHDWRVPTRDELASISDPRKKASPPTANTDFFPHMRPDEYWSSNDYAFQWNAAWLWNYRFGHDRVEWKASPRHVRLVRGYAALLDRVED